MTYLTITRADARFYVIITVQRILRNNQELFLCCVHELFAVLQTVDFFTTSGRLQGIINLGYKKKKHTGDRCCVRVFGSTFLDIGNVLDYGRINQRERDKYGI